MLKNMKFATKLLLAILIISIASLIAVATISYMQMLNLSSYSQDANTQLGLYASDSSQEALIKQTETYLIRLAASEAQNSNAVLDKVEKDVLVMAAYMEEIYANPDNFKGRMLPRPDQTAEGTPSSKVQLAPGVDMSRTVSERIRLLSNADYLFGNVFLQNSILHNVYMGTREGLNYRFSPSAVYTPEYDPRQRPWYQAAIKSENAIWLDTYVDAYGEVGTTCAKAFKGKDGQVEGVVATDIMLDAMVNNILDVKIGKTGYAFLIDDAGTILAHPDYEKVGYNPLEDAEGRYKDMLQHMTIGNAGLRQVEISGKEYYVAFAPLEATGWSLGIAVESDEVVSGAIAMKEQIDKGALVAKDALRDMLSSVLIRFVVLVAVAIILVLISSLLVAGSITKPVAALTRGVKEVGAGNLDYEIPVNSKDEVGMLADAFNDMASDLKQYTSRLAMEVAERERINGELEVGARIQNDMLPKIFPKFETMKNMQLFASNKSAKEVGGDFYDFFYLNDDQTKICTVIADVSGKGIPAALFMVVAKTLIKNQALAGHSVDEILCSVNNMLCEDNQMNMFVTVFLGILDMESGEYTYASAGHNPPLIKQGMGEFRYLKSKVFMPLGAIEDISYKSSGIAFENGDVMVLYTDGVTEAMNPELDLLGDDLLESTLNGAVNDHPEAVAAAIDKMIEEFTRGHEQSDDITMLIFKYLR